MSDDRDFAPRPVRPKSWDDIFGITQNLKGVPILEIEMGRLDWEYMLSSSDQRPCGRAGCEQKHAHGWLVALSGQRFVHIGNDCAKKYSPEIWDGKVKDYRERRNVEARAEALVHVRGEAQRKQYWLDNSPELDAAIALHDSFAAAARGALLSEIERRAERGLPVIERDVRLTVEERENRIAMLSAPLSEGEPAPYVPAVERIKVAELSGLLCFRPLQTPKDLRRSIQTLVQTLLTWTPKEGDKNADRAMSNAMRELAPLSNQLNSSVVATRLFFSESNLQALMQLEVIAGQGIRAITRDGPNSIRIERRAYWNNKAA